MNERALSLLEQYDIEVLRTRKGRGTFICDTKQGSFTLKEYFGNPEKLMIQQHILTQIKEAGLVKTEELVPNKENLLYVKDSDDIFYIVKTSVEGSECNIYDGRECIEAIRLLAKLHNCMQPRIEVEKLAELFTPYSTIQEYEKHNRELVRVRSFLKKKGQKQIFEIRLLGVMDYYINQAQRITEGRKQLQAKKEGVPVITFCHGDYQYHNILRAQDGWYIINFDKMLADNPVRDIYLFMRKVMEKNNWIISLGKEMLAAYEEIRKLDGYSRMDLYYRFAYPEKFWKIVNFYYNASKAWIPEKNMEKLEKVILQEREKHIFLREIFKMGEV